MPTAKDTSVARRQVAPPTSPPPAALFTPRIPEHALEVVPGCVHLCRNWLPKKLADQVGVRIIDETYEMSLPQYRVGRKGVPVKDEDNRLVRFGDPDIGAITYKNKEHNVNVWSPGLLELKTLVQDEVGVPFNTAGIRYLVGGKIMQDPRSDVMLMPSLGDVPCIAQVGFGATRRHEFRAASSPDKVAFECEVHHGDLLLMHGRSQLDWLHGMPPAPGVKASRVQVTFRFILPGFKRTVSGARTISSSRFPITR